MSKQRRSENEAAEVVRLLAPLAAESVEPPPCDAIYWRARARLALEEAGRRRNETLRPLWLFHLATGLGALALAAVSAAWPLFGQAPLGGEGPLVTALPIAVFAAGAFMLTEARRLRTLGF